MAKKVIRRSKGADKWKSKKWYTIIAPKMFDLRELGETPAQKPKLLEGRVIEKSLDSLSGQRKLRHVTLKFKVTNVQELKAHTELVSLEIKQPYISRLVRRRRSKISTVLKVFTKDGKTVRVTAMAICTVKLKRTKETEIRKLMEESIAQAASQQVYDRFMHEAAFSVIATNLLKQLKDIAKFKRIEIVKAKLLEGK